jgi:hypothetical protein
VGEEVSAQVRHADALNPHTAIQILEVVPAVREEADGVHDAFAIAGVRQAGAVGKTG